MRRLIVVGIGMVVLGCSPCCPGQSCRSPWIRIAARAARRTRRPPRRSRRQRRSPSRSHRRGGHEDATSDVGPKPKVIVGPVETRRVYQISFGSWSHQFSVPESIDLLDIADRARGVFGMLAILGVAVFLSENRRAISGRVVFWGLALQWGFGLLVLRVPAGIQSVDQAGKAVKSVLDCALEGAEFVFGEPLVDPNGPGSVRLCLSRLADGHLRRGPVRRALSPRRDAMGRARRSPG